MRQFRNPRYAPESLERKLSPSGFFAPVAAEFAHASSAASAGPRIAPYRGFVTPPRYTLIAVEASAFAGPPVEPSPSPSPSPNPDPSPDPNPGTGEPPWDAPSDPTGPTEPA